MRSRRRSASPDSQKDTQLPRLRQAVEEALREREAAAGFQDSLIHLIYP